jgi:hypothetical protein
MEVETFLAHHGVKGMKWGVRKKENEPSGSDSKNKKWSSKKKVIVGLGSTAAVAAIAVGALYAKKHFGVSMENVKVSKPTEKLVDDLLHEPTDVIYATRGKQRGFGILNNGGLNSPLREMDSSGLREQSNTFHRYGKNRDKIAVAFDDPHGRKDRSGRIIPHMVVLPKEHAKGIDTFDAAKNKAWSLVKDTFNSLYESDFDKQHQR